MDIVLAFIDRLPGPPWATYLALIVLSIVVTVGLRVLDGAKIDALVIVFAGLSFAPFAVMHYINGAAKRALEDFRPALGDLEPEYPEFERQLTTTSIATGVVGAGIVTVGTLTVGGAWGVTADNWIVTNVVTIFLQLTLNTSLVIFLLHEVGHLRTITRIHRETTNIQLWNVRPHNAFRASDRVDRDRDHRSLRSRRDLLGTLECEPRDRHRHRGRRTGARHPPLRGTAHRDAAPARSREGAAARRDRPGLRDRGDESPQRGGSPRPDQWFRRGEPDARPRHRATGSRKCRPGRGARTPFVHSSPVSAPRCCCGS